MNKKRKTGILLILIGIGIPLVLLFFQDDGYIVSKRYKYIERKLNPKEIEVVKKEREKETELMKRRYPELFSGGEKSRYGKWEEIELEKDNWKKEKWTIRTEIYSIPYRYSVGIGIILIIIGIGMIIFSLPSKEAKPKNSD